MASAPSSVLVLLTAQLAVAVPHFALLSGFVGGMTDTLQSLVLPPLVYLAETRRRRLRTMPSILLDDGDGDGDGDGATAKASGRRRGRGVAREWAELVFCSLLAAAGAAFIVFATTSNVEAIMAFVASQRQQGADETSSEL